MGNSLLGGIDFDEEILKLIKIELEKIEINFNELDTQTKIRIRKACEKFEEILFSNKAVFSSSSVECLFDDV